MVRVLRQGSSVTCLSSTEKICKDGPEVEFDSSKQCPTVFIDQVVEEHTDMLVDSEGNNQERAKNDHGIVRDLEYRKLQMDGGETSSRSLAQEDNHEMYTVESGILDRKLSNLGRLVSDDDHAQVMEREKIGTTTQRDDKENGNLQLDEDIGKCDEFDVHGIIKHDLEVPNSGVVLHGSHSEPGNRIQDVSSPSEEFMYFIEKEDVTKESPDEEYMIEDEGHLRMLLMVSQHYDDGEISCRMDVNETSNTSSGDASIAVYDLSKENNTYEDDETIDDGDDGSQSSRHSTEEVEHTSEGTTDSSAESNSEAIWPIETIQETGPEKCNVEKINIERLISKGQMKHDEEGNFNLIFKTQNGRRTRLVVDWYSLYLNSMKWIILLGTLLAFCCICASDTMS